MEYHGETIKKEEKTWGIEYGIWMVCQSLTEFVCNLKELCANEII